MLKPVRLFVIALAVACSAGAAPAACRSQSFEGAAYIVCGFDPRTADLRMLWRGPDHRPYGTFAAVAAALQSSGATLAFAMNGGMYKDDLSPVGLYVEDGETLHPVNRTSVTVKPEPNFYKKPNGVFYIAEKMAGILTTEAYLRAAPPARYATQSGPMLVIAGAIHPAFIKGSTDRKRRDGVGLKSTHEVIFVIADDPINFDDFARFFRDELGCADALFLDGGSAPGLYVPELGRDDPPSHGGYGPMIAVVATRAP